MCDHCGCRAYAPIADLTADHVRILELAWRVAEGDWPDDDSRRTGQAELNALLDVHALKEELGLYPLLIDTGGLEADTCARLEAEHREVHDVLERGTFDRVSYYALAAHIEEEEMELFSGARFTFDEDEWEAMSAAHHDAMHHHGLPHSH